MSKVNPSSPMAWGGSTVALAAVSAPAWRNEVRRRYRASLRRLDRAAIRVCRSCYSCDTVLVEPRATARK